ncbi:MAG TPA: ABC transporter permease [Chloroflexota bacterium]|jgi:peptide/nickel transport system permease protein
MESDTWQLSVGASAPGAALPWPGAEAADEAPTSYWGRFGRRFLDDRLAVAAVVTLVVIAGAALAAPWLAPTSELDGDVALRLAPLGTAGHLLGTDEQGRDMLTRLLHGARLTLLAGFVPVVAAGLIGGVLGMIAGYYRGVVGGTILRVMDVFYAFPTILLAIGLAAALGPGLRNAIIALSVVFIPPVVRVAETATRRVMVQEFVEAARASGATAYQIIRYHVAGNVAGPVFVYASTLFGVSIVFAAGLSFLGLGVTPPTAEWGLMLSSLKDAIYTNPVVAILPGAAIFVTSVAFNLLSDGVRDAFDVRL